MKIHVIEQKNGGAATIAIVRHNFQNIRIYRVQSIKFIFLVDFFFTGIFFSTMHSGN